MVTVPRERDTEFGLQDGSGLFSFFAHPHIPALLNRFHNVAGQLWSVPVRFRAA